MRNDDQPPDPAIEQAKEELWRAICEWARDAAPAELVNVCISSLIKSSASRLQEVEAELKEQVELRNSYLVRANEVGRQQGRQEVEAELAWQPIDKWATIPYSSVLLCYFDHGERIVTEGFHDGHNWMDVANQKARKPTHVRELPSPPGRVSQVAGEKDQARTFDPSWVGNPFKPFKP